MAASAYAKITDGVVVNSVLADAAFAKVEGLVPLPAGAGIGWLYDGKAFTPPLAPPEPVPAEVSPAQAKIALYNAGLYERIRSVIAGGSAYEPMRIWFESALVWRLDNPNILALAAELGLTDDQVDDLFRAAAMVPQ